MVLTEEDVFQEAEEDMEENPWRATVGTTIGLVVGVIAWVVIIWALIQLKGYFGG